MPLNVFPALPTIIEALQSVLGWMGDKSSEWRDRYPNLPDPPAEFRDQVLPRLVEATGDPAYAEQVMLRAWRGIQSKEAGYNRHHGGLA